MSEAEIPVGDQALLEWSNLNYFIPSKTPKVNTRMVDAQDEKAFLANEDFVDDLAYQNAQKGIP